MRWCSKVHTSRLLCSHNSSLLLQKRMRQLIHIAHRVRLSELHMRCPPHQLSEINPETNTIVMDRLV